MRIAGAGEKNKNPYGSRSCPGPAPRRDDAGTDEPGRWTRRETARTSRCGARIGVVKLLRARGGCLGVISNTGVEGCDKSGGAAERASIPECPSRPGELKHLSTRRKRKQPRLPQ